MTQFSPDDRPLIDFLRQYRPPVPTAAPDLEDQIMQAAQNSSLPDNTASTSRSLVSWPRRRAWWQQRKFVPAAIAAGLLLAWAGHFQYTQMSLTAEAEAAQLEAFLVESWDGSLANESSSDAIVMSQVVDPTSSVMAEELGQ